MNLRELKQIIKEEVLSAINEEKTIPNVVTSFAKKYNLHVKPVNFNHKDTKKVGFDILDSNGAIQITLEPRIDGSGKWKVSDYVNDKHGDISTLGSFVKFIGSFTPKDHTGYRRK